MLQRHKKVGPSGTRSPLVPAPRPTHWTCDSTLAAQTPCKKAEEERHAGVGDGKAAEEASAAEDEEDESKVRIWCAFIIERCSCIHARSENVLITALRKMKQEQVYQLEPSLSAGVRRSEDAQKGLRT
jgi:hypothetical protein